MKKQLIIIAALFLFIVIHNLYSQITLKGDSSDYEFITDIPYKAASSEYEKERCMLDLYLPKEEKVFPVVVWFHGGGLKYGDKSEDHATVVAKALVTKKIGVVLVNYRLNPKVKFPEYIYDAASAVKWTISNISKYDGDSENVFIGGHSAGAFLTYMLGLSEEYLGMLNISKKQIAGLVPVSSQVYCHSTIRKELGIKEEKVINETCPLYYINNSAPPIKCLLAEEDIIIEDNQYLIKKLKDAGHLDCEINIIPKRDHMSLIMEMKDPDDPALLEIVQFINDKLNIN
jgi:acetyl esterase/lipase